MPTALTEIGIERIPLAERSDVLPPWPLDEARVEPGTRWTYFELDGVLCCQLWIPGAWTAAGSRHVLVDGQWMPCDFGVKVRTTKRGQTKRLSP